ncbi:biotin--acetyl-CoA-carboxylase ligase [Bifidobacterium sp. CP2]|uniref:biotin--[acetyl-CoA-carboxylase] ligase n=1 Tax=Bifidobacterium sp. CP2 TaxID=2809025 RepID=UPI001BDD0F39|nr:biotin--acetyl-CoA-carboxylase ligase [Bifidobacterium sp. CP2]MBT1181667.1 biotin--acetyl-CoA-carboxylase ligase [Bifidobacterium sp. CP2]
MPRTAAVARRVAFVDETGSTNTLARRLVASAALAVADETSRMGVAPSVDVVATDRQTAGRGRLDHTWVSGAGESSTVSYVMRVPYDVARDETVNGWLQMIAGLATLDGLRAALRRAGARPLHADAEADGDAVAVAGGKSVPVSGDVVVADRLGLKWPNDIFVGDRKLGGILAELVPLPEGRRASETVSGVASDALPGVASGSPVSGSPASGSPADVAIVFGVGLNLAVPADRLPTAQATSLHLHYGPLSEGDAMRDMIAAGTVAALRRRLAAFTADPHGEAVSLRRETASCCVTLGRRAVAHFVDGRELVGEAIALNDDASLALRSDDGAMHVVRTADVGVLPA